MVRQGMLNKQIAHELGVGETTVKAHVSEIMRKLNVVSSTQAVIEVARLDFDAILAPTPEDADKDPASRTQLTVLVGRAAQLSRLTISALSSAGFTGLSRISQPAACTLPATSRRMVRRDDDRRHRACPTPRGVVPPPASPTRRNRDDSRRE